MNTTCEFCENVLEDDEIASGMMSCKDCSDEEDARIFEEWIKED